MKVALNSSDCATLIEVFIYFLCFVIGGPLNVISLRKSLRAFSQHKAKSPILLLRINLNLADLCTLFVYVPKQIIWMLTFQWYGGGLLCQVCSFFSTFPFYANSFVIACIAIDRVFGAYNMSSINAHRRAYLRCRRLLVIGWLAAFTLSLPQAVIFRITQDLKDMQRLEKMYNINHLLFVFWIPCTIIIISYLTVLLILQGHLREGTNHSPSIPYNVVAVLNMTRILSEHRVFSVTLSFLNCMICANPIVNPLIYGILTKTGKQ
ncbi:unnamed protein product [Heligmosomoides polygyrus]|uniref:G-protein coupled receptors family 1 profile domain-containing protein n=1 Tax=Heligmosomoides polygyrus TaxID=6339 RepID=A0A3P7ZG49_HELPZ|nr:unnamed protein product [Heligmosomoides polygyrus]